MEAQSANTQTANGRSINAAVWRWTFRVSNGLPAVWIGLFFAFVFATWLEVGHIPTYGSPDPKDTVLAWLFMPVIYLTFPLVMAGAVTWPILAGLGAVNLLPTKSKLQNLLLLVIPILIILWIRFQTGLFEWFVD
jgi:hypothetical protein